jgi:hypothetical protein
MAAEGRSNPEIAQALFITKKTVEAHLASVYRKLEIRSRSQLEFALRGSPEGGLRGGQVAADRGYLRRRSQTFSSRVA